MSEPRLVTDAPLAHLEWRRAGAGEARAPLAVLLHGVGGGREGFPATGAALAARGFRVLAADQPGYGLSGPIEPHDMAGMAEAVRRLIAWATGDVRGGAFVVGHSMGGMVAQELAASAPHAVRALVLAATSPAFGSPDGSWQAGFLRSRFAPLDAGLGMPGLAAQLVPAMAGRDAQPDRLAVAQTLMAGVPEATYRRALAALVRFDRREALARIAVPTLVVTGEDDRTAAPEVARRMAARIPGAEVAIVPGTGHLLMLEQPERFDGVLLDFVARRVRMPA